MHMRGGKKKEESKLGFNYPVLHIQARNRLNLEPYGYSNILLSNGQSRTSKNPEKHLDQNSLLNPPRISLCQSGELRKKQMHGGLRQGSQRMPVCLNVSFT